LVKQTEFSCGYCKFTFRTTRKFLEHCLWHWELKHGKNLVNKVLLEKFLQEKGMGE